jgi:hypothetical protein
MALKGTLKDFGIADIFQLISHQSKTGVLHLHSGDQEVRISFVSGDVVRAESSTRQKQDLLGAILVRAEVINESQLQEALELQRRTLRRLGDILVERGALSREDLRQFARLQTTETIYKLFHWQTGTYLFESEEVVYDKESIEPIRSENILMEGFRMVDEWPMVRKRVTSYDLTFRKVKDLPARAAGGGDDLDGAFDEAFGEKPAKESDKTRDIGPNEERVFSLVREDRSVQKLIDLSRLGEFDTCKALLNLLNGGFLEVAGSIKDAARSEGRKPGGRTGGLPIARILLQIGMYLLLAGAGFLVYRLVDLDLFGTVRGTGLQPIQTPAVQEFLDGLQTQRLRAALELFRMERGDYPEKLQELAQAGLVSERDLAYPWRQMRDYRRRESGYLLVRPLQ